LNEQQLPPWVLVGPAVVALASAAKGAILSFLGLEQIFVSAVYSSVHLSGLALVAHRFGVRYVMLHSFLKWLQVVHVGCSSQHKCPEVSM
jgi:hypothetical protein